MKNPLTALFAKLGGGVAPVQTGSAVVGANADFGVGGAGGGAYRAADTRSKEMAGFTPRLQSADRGMLPAKARAEGRARDLVNNNGYASGAVKSQKNRLVGPSYKLQLQPVYKLLDIKSQASASWSSMVEVAFHAWANDPDCWIDYQRKRTFTQLLHESVQTEFVQGECFLIREWVSSPVGYSTCFRTVAPERVSTPNQYGAWGAGEVTLPNGNRIRAGIELNAAGAAVAVHIASRHPNDFGTVGLGNVQWQRITIRNEFGWLQVIHMFDSEQADQTRGFSTMAATLHKLKMGDMQEDLELQSTHLGTKYGMYLKSPLAKHRAAEIFESEGAEGLQKAGQNLMAAQDAYYGSTGAVIDGVKIMAMFPDDEVGTVQPNQQPANHEQFKEGMMRQNAKAWGISFEEATGDFSKTSYSSARAAMQLSYLNTLTKRANFVNKIATQIFRLWFDEAIVKGYIQPPEGVDYWPSNAVESGQKFSWLTSCTWIGAGKIVIDEFKQTKANTEGMATGQFSRQDVLAEGGTDLESVADAMVAEREAYLERGLPLPEHLGGSPRGTPRVLTPAEEAALADETN